MDIERFKKEHADLMAAVTSLRELVQHGVGERADAIHRQLSAMNSAIKLHLAAEDRMLYPALMKAADPAVAQTGRQFQEEMGGLGRVFTDYNNKWQTSAIRTDVEGFANETRKVFGALAKRIERENNELYPLADNAG